jgi:transposase
MKLEVVTDATGLPLGMLQVSHRRKNAIKPLRNDNWQLCRYRRRWVVERTHAWLQSYRSLAVRWSVYAFMHVGLIYLGFIHLALQRL